MPQTLSLCMIAKDEERHLQTCLDSVRDLVDEIIVVDTGSTDATQEIATRNGATVIPFDFSYVDFSSARNIGLANASCASILVLDADETLDSSSLPVIKAILGHDNNAGYYAARRNHGGGGLNEATDHVVRLFPNRPEYRFRGRVHETIDAAILAGGGSLRVSDILIHHKFATHPDVRQQKNHRYIEILKEELASDPTDNSRLDFLAAEYHQLGLFDEATCVAECIAQVRPQDPLAQLNAGIYHLVFKPDLAQARADFNRALELRPNYQEALSFLQTLDEREQGGCIRGELPELQTRT